ncbi:Site-specific recombinase XerD [Pseudonocardia ammonioxydans]|uniref:Site-specific recombinase XerD n=1 Tax=Pseudonocardia ammonioxydans TaxID=260086 RepID=A0A1I5I470_PSUAM|nr:tyrosine-type recombinase/integrase [Pseudonocardia ammonioxydans]SFO55384.1 Site-specific recombinase XerD [Pseudonocardia ammonioxydans]
MSSGTAAEDGGEPVRGSVVLDGVRDPAGERRVAAQRAASLEALAARADAHATGARAPRTHRAYAADWAHFAGWCTTAALEALPAEVNTVRLYLADLEATCTPDGSPVFSPATMARRLAAIAAVHRDTGHSSPTRDPAVGAVLTGIKRARAHATHQMRPLLLDDLRTLLAMMEFGTWPGGLTAARDSVVLLTGFAGALRRSELAALTVGDLRFHPSDGLHVRIRSSKTDQDAHGATVVLPYGTHAGTCPPCAVLRWLRLAESAPRGRAALMRAVLSTPAWAEQDHLYPHPDPATETDDAATSRGDSHGPAPVPALPAEAPLLRAVRRGGTLTDTPITGDALHAMVRRRATTAGLPGPVGFHSLRAGFVTTARRAGADHRAVRRQTRHSSDAMVETYDRDHAPLLGNAVTQLGL